MDISLILKIAGIGFLVSVAYMVLNKAGRDEIAVLVSVAGVIIALTLIITKTADLLDTVKSVFDI